MRKQEIKKINYPLIIAGLIMLIASGVNYSINEDFISLGIFVFAGLGFILLGAAAAFSPAVRKRTNRYAFMFFTLSLLVLAYWFLHGKLEII
jgi:hypothetical protein